jgi:hypothetical protein
MDTAKGIGKNKELFLDYGQGYWEEGTFEEYLAGREEMESSEGGTEENLEQGDPEFTYGSDTAEGT